MFGYSFLGTRLAELNSKIRQAEQNVQFFDQELLKAIKTRNDYKSELSSAELDITAAQITCDEKKSLLAEKRINLEHLQSSIAKNQKKWRDLNFELVEDKSHLDAKNSELKSIQEKMILQEKRRENNLKERLELNKIICGIPPMALLGRVHRITGEFLPPDNQGQIDAFHQRVAVAKRKHAELEKEEDYLTNQISEEGIQLISLKADISVLKYNCQELPKELKALSASIDIEENESKKIESEIEQLEYELTNANANLNQAKSQVESLKSELDFAENAITSAQINLEYAQDELSRLRREHEELSLESESAEKLKTDTEVTLADLWEKTKRIGRGVQRYTEQEIEKLARYYAEQEMKGNSVSIDQFLLQKGIEQATETVLPPEPKDHSLISLTRDGIGMLVAPIGNALTAYNTGIQGIKRVSQQLAEHEEEIDRSQGSILRR